MTGSQGKIVLLQQVNHLKGLKMKGFGEQSKEKKSNKKRNS